MTPSLEKHNYGQPPGARVWDFLCKTVIESFSLLSVDHCLEMNRPKISAPFSYPIMKEFCCC